MAGEWIRIRPSLATHPKIIRIADVLAKSPEFARWAFGENGNVNSNALRVTLRYVTVTACVTLWGNANENTTDGFFPGIMLSSLDEMAGVPGFGEAFASVGWAKYDAERGGVLFPNFNEYNTVSTERKSSAERVKAWRDRKRAEKLAAEAAAANYDKRNGNGNAYVQGREEKNIKTGAGKSTSVDNLPKARSKPGESREAYEARCRQQRDAAR